MPAYFSVCAMDLRLQFRRVVNELKLRIGPTVRDLTDWYCVKFPAISGENRCFELAQRDDDVCVYRLWNRNEKSPQNEELPKDEKLVGVIHIQIDEPSVMIACPWGTSNYFEAVTVNAEGKRRTVLLPSEPPFKKHFTPALEVDRLLKHMRFSVAQIFHPNGLPNDDAAKRALMHVVLAHDRQKQFRPLLQMLDAA